MLFGRAYAERHQIVFEKRDCTRSLMELSRPFANTLKMTTIFVPGMITEV